MDGIRHAIRIDGNGDAFLCGPDQRLLEAMETARATDLMRRWLKTIPVGCRRGGCGVCRVRVTEGDYHTTAMSAAHVSEAERAEGYALACCIYPRGPLTVVPAPRHPNQIKALHGAAAVLSMAAAAGVHSIQEQAPATGAGTGGNR